MNTLSGSLLFLGSRSLLPCRSIQDGKCFVVISGVLARFQGRRGCGRSLPDICCRLLIFRLRHDNRLALAVYEVIFEKHRLPVSSDLDKGAPGGGNRIKVRGELISVKYDVAVRGDKDIRILESEQFANASGPNVEETILRRVLLASGARAQDKLHGPHLADVHVPLGALEVVDADLALDALTLGRNDSTNGIYKNGAVLFLVTVKDRA